MSVASTTLPQIDRIKDYFRRSDRGEFAAELFTPDFQFYWPKYGVGKGLDQFYEMATGVGGEIASIAHHIDELFFIEQGVLVAVEGTTQGKSPDGAEWHGGKTAGGRFSSIFVFNAEGLIERMHVYLDPDLAGRHEAGFRWEGRTSQRW